MHERTHTLHVVAAPAIARPVSRDVGRLAPVLLLAHALREGHCPAGPVLLVGPDGAARAAAACGLEHTASLTLPLGEPLLGRRALRRRARGLNRLICWSDELAPLVRRAAHEVHLVSTDPARCPAPARHFARITTLTDHDAAAWRVRGAAPVRADAWIDEIRHAPPALPRTDLRRRLAIPDDQILIAALRDRPADTDARALAFLLSVLHTTGYPVCAVTPTVAANIAVARRHLVALVRRYRLLLTEHPLPALLHEIDLAVVPEGPPTGASMILQAAAEARGCRVIRLTDRGKAGLRSAPGAAAPLLDVLESIIQERGRHHRPEPAHAS